jgi:hypothetical protein
MLTRIAHLVWPEYTQDPVPIQLTEEWEKRDVEQRLFRLEKRLTILEEEVRVVSRTTEPER